MSTTFKTSSQFPPLAWLGYGLDLTRLDPFDFEAVASAKTQVRIIDTTKDTNTQTVTIGMNFAFTTPFSEVGYPGGVEYEIPRIVAASEDNRSQGGTNSFTDGALAVSSLQGDSALANLPCRRETRFFFFFNDHDAYSGRLRDFLDFINEEELLTHVSELLPFEPEDPEVVQAYVDFFNTEVWASNKYEEVNENFNRNVTASVRGLNAGGEYDQAVFREPQYHIFNRISQRIVRVRGGNPGLADALMESPEFATFQQWTESILGNPELTTFKAAELWTLLRDANDKTLRDSAPHIRNAFEYLSSLRNNAPNDKHTWVIFEMDSDWGEFGILTPSVVIGGGDRDQIGLPGQLALGPPKLHYGSPRSAPQHLIVVVELINDGTPIDIYISSGSGSASVKILGVRLISPLASLSTDTAIQEDYATSGGTNFYRSVPVSL
ncbi:hypothetical protein J3R82DRAFT_7494 [Butyriboletus roseoflavus]|nr:hypothetical protein J3R82DRAFT_7494 [Butyriboletus roseoflavus]